jgi:predicted nucleic acid-binding protein
LRFCEALETKTHRIEEALLEHPVASLTKPALAVAAAANLPARCTRHNRLQIGTFCIERGHALLHLDRDFEPMERLLGSGTV